MQAKLTIALQKSGRLADGCMRLFQNSGINITTAKNKLLIQDKDFGVDFIFARDDDIPGLVANGVCDLGIVGANLLQEYNLSTVSVIKKLGFAKCRLSIAKPTTIKNMSLSDLNDKAIATSYPNILTKFLNENDIKANIVTMHGSVELAPKIGVADYIFDLVSSGATLKENGLSEFMVVAQSEAVLIGSNKKLSQSKQVLLDRLLLRIDGVMLASKRRYIMMHLDRDKVSCLSKIIPGCEAPTILQLQDIPQKVAVHLVSIEELFWDTIEKLKEIGATSILVLPIEKMID